MAAGQIEPMETEAPRDAVYSFWALWAAFLVLAVYLLLRRPVWTLRSRFSIRCLALRYGSRKLAPGVDSMTGRTSFAQTPRRVPARKEIGLTLTPAPNR